MTVVDIVEVVLVGTAPRAVRIAARSGNVPYYGHQDDIKRIHPRRFTPPRPAGDKQGK
ncbi:MAG: hypothetical protein MZV70_15295 [Desulfobacterales bacterium]|nr:hypothetical protein [Desulfobacterales bacterium]